MQAARGSLRPPDGIDAPTANAVLVACAQQLVLSASASGVFAGMSLKDNADWSWVRAVLTALVLSLYGE
jgi:hypothetical protein